MTRRQSSKKIVYDAVLAVKNALDANPFTRKSITELTPDMYVGRNQFQIIFKAITGNTFRRYRLVKRMEAACELLAPGIMSVKELATKCGYRRNPNNFSKDFKKVFKQSPEYWLQHHLIGHITVTP
jgi:two-component system, response regulator YesN